MVAARGRLLFSLHAHLPYVVGHGMWPFGEEWLHEAAAESYLPLLRMLQGLSERGMRNLLSIDFSPILCEQLTDPRWQGRFIEYCASRKRFARENRRRLEREGAPDMARAARMWHEHYSRVQRDFELLGRNIVSGFRELEQRGVIEIYTCGATHGYLPLLGEESSVRAQVSAAQAAHHRHFGRAPRGIWAPECAYRPRGEWAPPGGGIPRPRAGVEEFLGDAGLDYFVVDTHLLHGGRPSSFYRSTLPALARMPLEEHLPPREGFDTRDIHLAGTTERPAEDARVAFFTRDERTGMQVWSGEHGYPGDGRYLEFHRRHEEGGLRYWRVTRSSSGLDEKLPYQRGPALDAVRDHARHFVELLESVVLDSPGGACVCAPYDAELMGHWWFEGPQWLEAVLLEASKSRVISPATFSHALSSRSPERVVDLPEGSWGEGGRHRLWRNPEVDWSWELIHPAEERMADLAREALDCSSRDAREAAKCAGRQLLLLESSDWQFLISTGGAPEYAAARLRGHAEDFHAAATLAEALLRRRPVTAAQRERVRILSDRDRIFPDLDLQWWASGARAKSASVAPRVEAPGKTLDPAFQLKPDQLGSKLPRPGPAGGDLVHLQGLHGKQIKNGVRRTRPRSSSRP